MAKGGRREGAGRPKGSITRVRVSDYFTEEEKREFFEDLKLRAREDSKIALYLAEQLTGKAPQAVELGVEGGLSITFDNAFTSKAAGDSSE